MPDALTTIEPVATTRVAPPGVTKMPDDLRQELGWHRLFLLTLDAVLAVAPTPGRNANVLLSVTTYCYAAKVLSSGDIEAATSEQWDVAYIIRGRTLTAADVRRFRRIYRPVMEQCLQRVFLDAVRMRLTPHAFETDLDGWSRKAVEFAQHRLKLAILMDTATAD